MTDPELLRDLEGLPAESRTVSAAGLMLHVLDYGGERPPMLVLPGITSPAITWDFVARRLTADARVLVLDLRGRGLSSRPPESYRLEDYAADVGEVIEALALERPMLLGHSLGARIAAAMAVERRDLAGSLLLVDPPMSGPGREPYPTPLEAFLDQLHEAQEGTTADAVRRHYPRWPKRELELRARWLPTCSEAAVVQTHRGFENEDFFALWPRLEPPVTLVHGADSPVVTARGAEEAARANPAADVVAIAGAGHMVPWDNLEDFLNTVMSRLSPQPSG